MQSADRKYADIVDIPRPAMKHQRMGPAKRAKIFAPFDALEGYDEKIEEVDERNKETTRNFLYEEEQEIISGKLSRLSKGSVVCVNFFVPGQSEDIGTYKRISGEVEKFDTTEQYIRLIPDEHWNAENDGLCTVRIDFRDITEISISNECEDCIA